MTYFFFLVKFRTPQAKLTLNEVKHVSVQLKSSPSGWGNWVKAVNRNKFPGVSHTSMGDTMSAVRTTVDTAAEHA